MMHTGGTGYHEATLAAVRIDLADHSRVEVSGPDAAAFLHNLCTQDIRSLPVGQTRETFLCTNKARVVAHLFVTRFPDAEGAPLFRLQTVPDQAAGVLDHLGRYLISEQVELTDISATWRTFLLVGPQAARVASAHVADHFQRVRSDLSLPAVEIWALRPAAVDIWEQLAALGLPVAGAETLDVLRLEAGTPRFGVDIDEQRFAVEVGRTQQAICYTKGCYLGQEPIVMARDRGHVNRLLVGLLASGDEPFVTGSKVFAGDLDVGQVTSSAFSPRLGKVIALAYLRRGYWEAGAAVNVFPPSQGRAAAVASLPFIAALD